MLVNSLHHAQRMTCVFLPLFPPSISQIDGSTLRTLCMQHGPLITFHLNLTQGNAVVRYSSKDEAAKAQKSLHMYERRGSASQSLLFSLSTVGH